MGRIEAASGVYLVSILLVVALAVFAPEIANSTGVNLLILAVHLTYFREIWKDVRARGASNLWILGTFLFSPIGLIYTFWHR